MKVGGGMRQERRRERIEGKGRTRMGKKKGRREIWKGRKGGL